MRFYVEVSTTHAFFNDIRMSCRYRDGTYSILNFDTLIYLTVKFSL